MSGSIRESPADFRNGDLISRLLAATPPYQTNSTFVPHRLYFSEMLKRLVQAKSYPPLLNKRGRKRNCKDSGKVEQLSEAKQSKMDFVPMPPAVQTEPQFPLWYPPFYTPTFPPMYFKTPEEPLNLQIRSDSLKQDRHYSAFRVPEPSKVEELEKINNKQGTSYLMGNLTKIYKQVAPEEEKIIDVEGDGPETTQSEENEKKDCKDLTALIGLELVVDYVKHGHNKGGQNDQHVNKCYQNA